MTKTRNADAKTVGTINATNMMNTDVEALGKQPEDKGGGCKMQRKPGMQNAERARSVRCGVEGFLTN